MDNKRHRNVVISFHFVSLTCWTQSCQKSNASVWRCDFLSFCIFDLLNTINTGDVGLTRLLWFPFILYLWLVEHNQTIWNKRWRSVVISFHFVSLTCWTQCRQWHDNNHWRCDFLSFCIFDLLNTIWLAIQRLFNMLWFPFILYLWLVEHNTC